MIKVTIEEGVAVVMLRRAEKRNAMTPEMLGSLVSAVAQVSRSDARAIVVGGEGAAFCAGFDLSLCKDHADGSVMRALLTGLSEAIEALRGQPLPVVMAAHGAAIAGGCALLGAADLVFTNDDAKIGYPVVRLGVSPAVSGPFLRLRVGDGVARERLLETRLIGGREAAACGLVSRSMATAAEVMPAAMDAARSLAAKPGEAMTATRAWLAEIENLGDSPWRALSASLALTGGVEERELLPAAWAPKGA
jgi:enoyl-CoA hydratase/carnithine racemase